MGVVSAPLTWAMDPSSPGRRQSELEQLHISMKAALYSTEIYVPFDAIICQCGFWDQNSGINS